MSQAAPEFGQGEKSLSKAATLVADAKRDFDGYAKELDDQISALKGRWVGQGGAAFFTLHQAWTEKQTVIVQALNEFEASLISTEHDNVSTDETQSANYVRTAGRLDGV
jgi:uncharacterized protein YukE